MAKRRSRAVELTQWFDAASRPVYVLDGELALVFCNTALLEWVGRQADELAGRRCRYHSRPDVTEIEATAAGLCPPPAALAGQETVASVACLRSDGRILRRQARFLPVTGQGEEPRGLLVLVDEEDLPDERVEPSAGPVEQAETVELHEQLRSMMMESPHLWRMDRLLGESPAICRARARAELAAKSDASVLIVGPVGSGRHHTARAIHQAVGTLRDAPGGRSNPASSRETLVPLECAVLGEDLIRSTLIALAAQEAPNRVQGTLLLEGVDFLPTEVQAHAARTLADPAFPYRVIGTATRPLEELVRQGAYRADLASLIGTIVIDLPPLVQRRQDLPLLCQGFVEQRNAGDERQLAGFSPEALDRLDAYHWPGNLDELVRVVAESFDQAEGPWIDVADLPQRIHLAATAAAHPPRQEETIVLDEYLAGIERELVTRALAQAKGNKAKAARLLGMTRPRLYRRLTQLGLEDEASDD